MKNSNAKNHSCVTVTSLNRHSDTDPQTEISRVGAEQMDERTGTRIRRIVAPHNSEAIARRRTRCCIHGPIRRKEILGNTADTVTTDASSSQRQGYDSRKLQAVCAQQRVRTASRVCSIVVNSAPTGGLQMLSIMPESICEVETGSKHRSLAR